VLATNLLVQVFVVIAVRNTYWWRYLSATSSDGFLSIRLSAMVVVFVIIFLVASKFFVGINNEVRRCSQILSNSGIYKQL
jgi:hypothetical protein